MPPHRTLETIRKERLRRLAYTLPEGLLSSPDQLSFLRNAGHFDLEPDDLAGTVIDRAAALCIVHKSVQQVPAKPSKAYVPEQRFYNFDAIVGPFYVPAGEILFILQDRTLLRLSPRIDSWLSTVGLMLPDDSPLFTNGTHKKNTCFNPETCGKKMCCDFAQGKCRAKRCPYAHVVDGRPCENAECPLAHSIVRLIFPLRPAEWFSWLRSDDDLPVIGVETQEGPKICRLPANLLVDCEEEFRNNLPLFFAKIQPKHKPNSAEDVQCRRKYFNKLIVSVYRKWQSAMNKQERAQDDESVSESLWELYPESWREMVTATNSEKKLEEDEEPLQDEPVLARVSAIKFATAPTPASKPENNPKVDQDREDWKQRFMDQSKEAEIGE